MKKVFFLIAFIGIIGISLIPSKEASAIGIIGGADGPRAVFLASTHPVDSYIAIGAVGLICIVFGLVLMKKKGTVN